MTGTTDSELMSKVRDGEVSYLAELFNRYHQPLFRYFVHLTGDRGHSEDLVQDVFFRLLKSRHTYRGLDFKPWLYQIARSSHIDNVRKKRPETGFPEGAEGEVLDFPSNEAGPEERFGRSEEVKLLQRALNGLQPDKRELLILSRFQELSYSEIAAIVQCEVSTLKVRIHRAMKELGSRYQTLAGERAS